MNRMIEEMSMIPSTGDLSVINSDRLRFEDITGNDIEYRLCTYEGETYVGREDVSSFWSLFTDPVPLIPFAESIAFDYLDEDDNAAATVGEVRKIRVAIVMSYEDSSYELETMVYPRNFN